MASLPWDAWIGQEKEPEEEMLPPAPPPVIDELVTGAYANELRMRAGAFRKESGDLRLPEAKVRSDFTPAEEKLSPELIKGLFRANQKMMLSGASKSGKSFMLIELALCLASGRPWLGYSCQECKVLYVNLEIAEASFLKRVDDVSAAIGLKRGEWNMNLKILNMRGFHTTLEQMRGALIGAALDEEADTGVPYSAIILDPIYKISNGEENSAKDVGAFCSQLDIICRETGSAIIFSHHHSKGDQGYKSAQDRASGSGVFARDADTMIDMIELEIDKDTYQAMKSYFACSYWIRLLDEQYEGWREDVGEDTLTKSGELAALYQTKAKLTSKVISYMNENIEADFQTTLKGKTPLRMEFTLREFASPEPMNCFFSHPVHVPDKDGVLAAADPVSHIQGQKKEKVKEAKKNKLVAFYETVCNLIVENGFTTYQDIHDVIGYSDDTIRRRLKEFEDEFETVKGGGNEKTKIYFKGQVPVA